MLLVVQSISSGHASLCRSRYRLFGLCQGPSRNKNKWLHNKLDLCVHHLGRNVSIIHCCCMLHATSILPEGCGRCNTQKKSHLGWSGISGLWCRRLCCWSRQIAYTALQVPWQHKHQRLHTRLDLCAHYHDMAVSTAAYCML